MSDLPREIDGIDTCQYCGSEHIIITLSDSFSEYKSCLDVYYVSCDNCGAEYEVEKLYVLESVTLARLFTEGRDNRNDLRHYVEGNDNE